MDRKTTIWLKAVLLLVILILLGGAIHLLLSLPSDNHIPVQNDHPDINTVKLPTNTLDDFDFELPRIGIYNGTGIWSVNVLAIIEFCLANDFEWDLFDENDITSKYLSDHFDLVWFPGGFAAEYKHNIPAPDNIRNFVDQGGIFIGSCAGAYYASSILSWKARNPGDFEYPLKLFDGRAIGPLIGKIAGGNTASVRLADYQPVNLGFPYIIEMYYFDGPYFEPYNADTIEVLAYYEINQKPAVIAGRYGEGKYLLLGPHPELGDNYANVSSGESGTQWPWLYTVIEWLITW